MWITQLKADPKQRDLIVQKLSSAQGFFDLIHLCFIGKIAKYKNDNTLAHWEENKSLNLEGNIIKSEGYYEKFDENNKHDFDFKTYVEIDYSSINGFEIVDPRLGNEWKSSTPFYYLNLKGKAVSVDKADNKTKEYDTFTINIKPDCKDDLTNKLRVFFATK